MERIHQRIRLFGVVQGVGFRPFVHRLAVSMQIAGTVCNKGSYVEIEAEAPADVMEAFIRDLKEMAPARSAILKTDVKPGPLSGVEGFCIIKSEAKAGDVFVSPDIGTCSACRAEMYDPKDRRYRHPFINCTACGPRLTILEGMPYDRVRTSMKAFPMCPDCAGEYTDPRSRRFHAQPVACPACGPALKILRESPKWSFEGSVSEDPLAKTREVIRKGGIAAIKGIGGFHLCCNALDAAAVQRLRVLKDRPTRPFAVMARDIEAARQFCEIDSAQESFLNGPERPILLLKKKGWQRPDNKEVDITYSVAPGNPYLGVMVPYAPVHYLIFDDPADTDRGTMPSLLVMTSANRKGCPICHNDEEALEELTAMADIILTHDREIRIRADDSVMAWIDGRPSMLRRSRGYAPLPIADRTSRDVSVLALGGELKNSFAVSTHDLIYPSAYLSDMADPRSLAALEDSVRRLTDLLEIRPDVIAIDSHPRYHVSAFGRRLAAERKLPVVPVQHHFAHVVSCMAENDLDEPVIGVAFDGTGYGDDGAVWGGEFFIASRADYQRAAALRECFLAGGDKAAYEGYRPAIAWLTEIYGEGAEKVIDSLDLCSEEEKRSQMALTRLKMNGAPTSSMGRLFDAASAILGICPVSGFEGEAAMALEYAATAFAAGKAGEDEKADPALLKDAAVKRDPADGNLFRLDPEHLIRLLVEGRLACKKKEELAYLFHVGTARMILTGCRLLREKSGLQKVVLSGGTMQNRLLVELGRRELVSDGFEVYSHQLIPANDNGIAVGQAAAVAAGYRGKQLTPEM